MVSGQLYKDILRLYLSWPLSSRTSLILSDFLGSGLRNRRNIQRCPQILNLLCSASAIIIQRQVLCTIWEGYSRCHQFSVEACCLLLCAHSDNVVTQFFYITYFWLCWGSSLLCGLFSSCDQWKLLSSCCARASHCGSFSCCGAQDQTHVSCNGRANSSLRSHQGACNSTSNRNFRVPLYICMCMYIQGEEV